MIGVFVGFSPIFLLGILIFKGLTARRLSKSFGVKGLTINFFDERAVESPIVHTMIGTKIR
jgi:hypothetical protein